MRVLLFLLLAVSTPASHHGASMPSAEAQTLAVERSAANAEHDTAVWTRWLAVWTGAMAGATVLAVGVPLGLRWRDRGEAASAAMRDLYQISTVFKTRVDKLAREPAFEAQALLEGLDVLLARALSDDISRALPNTTDTSYVYHALFTAYDALSDALHYQAPRNALYAQKNRDMAVASSVMLNRCLEGLTTELKRRKAEWKPSEIGAWGGTVPQSE